MIISIVTVCYNSANTIEQTLRSVIGQDHPNIEYIVIDGGSTDGTQEIIERFKRGIALYISEPDQGIYDAMNKGIQRATGDVVGLLNADDLYANSSVLSKVAKAFEDVTVEACYGDLIYFADREPGRVVRYWKAGEFKQGLFSKGWNPPHPTFFVRRAHYQRLGVFDTAYAMGNDVELMMRFLEKHRLKTAYIPELLVKMRLGGVSNRAFKNIFVQNKNIIQAAKNLDLPFSIWKFIAGKLIHRLSQFVAHEKRMDRYVG